MTTISRTSRKHLWFFAVCLLALELLNFLPEGIAEVVHPTAILSCSLLVAWALTIRRRILSLSVRKRLVAVEALMDYSIETYCYNRLIKSSDETFKSLIRAVMKYGKTAEAYFSN